MNFTQIVNFSFFMSPTLLAQGGGLQIKNLELKRGETIGLMNIKMEVKNLFQ